MNIKKTHWIGGSLHNISIMRQNKYAQFFLGPLMFFVIIFTDSVYYHWCQYVCVRLYPHSMGFFFIFPSPIYLNYKKKAKTFCGFFGIWGGGVVGVLPIIKKCLLKNHTTNSDTKGCLFCDTLYIWDNLSTSEPWIFCRNFMNPDHFI